MSGDYIGVTTASPVRMVAVTVDQLQTLYDIAARTDQTTPASAVQILSVTNPDNPRGIQAFWVARDREWHQAHLDRDGTIIFESPTDPPLELA